VRFLRPSVVVFCVALIASLCIHFPVYEVLGALAETLLHAPPAAKPTMVELELAPLAPAKPEDKDKPVPAVPEPQAKKDEPPEPPPQRPPERAQAPAPEPKPVVAEPEPVQPTPEPPPPTENPLAVTQKSDDPNVEAPENPRFIAEENRRVAEESIANVRNMHRDDPEPEPSSRPSNAEAQAEAGDSEEQEVADLQNVTGSEERTANEREAQQKPEQPSEASGGDRAADALARAQPAPQPATEQIAPARASGAPSGGAEETLIVQDAAGTFVIRKRPQGRGEGDEGGALQQGTPSAERTTRASSRQQTGTQPNLKLSWSQFQDTFGEEELSAQRQAYIAQRRSRTQGQNRQQMWKKFRAAIENFVPNVQPGTQTALNTAASPFAAYLATIHRRIHREYAFGFLRNLPIAGGPFDDRSLNTTLEIVINADGSVHKVGIAKTSGFLPFDYGAFDAVMRAAPYPVPPRKILSGDGRVYVHWGFYRNERQCGTFNAQPFILPHPGGKPEPGSPLRDEPDRNRPPATYEPHEGELGLLPPAQARER
jgi:TonB family protein